MEILRKLKYNSTQNPINGAHERMENAGERQVHNVREKTMSEVPMRESLLYFISECIQSLQFLRITSIPSVHLTLLNTHANLECASSIFECHPSKAK